MDRILYETSCTLSPLNYFKEALALSKKSENERALQYIDSAILLSSNCPFYIYQKIKFLFQTNPSQCQKYINEQLDFLYTHASLYLTCRTLDYYVQLMQLTPDTLQLFLLQKKLPNLLGNHYKSLLTTSVTSLIPMIQEKLIQDRLEECIAYCDIVLKGHSTSWEVYYYKGYAYHLLYDLYKAVALYKKALALNSTSPMLHNATGLALMELGAFSESLDYLKQATILKPNDPEYALHVAECYYSAKKYVEAQKYLEDLTKKFPNDLQAAFSLSHAYKIQNHKFLFNRYTKKIRKQLKRKTKKQ